MNILDYVDVDLLQNANKIYFKPYIPMPKMKNVINSFGFEIEPDDIEILIDNTVFGSAKEGIVITNEMLFCKELLKDPFIISLSNIESITVKKNTLSNSLILNDKKSIIDLSQPEYNDLELLFGGINIYLKEINEFNVVDEDEDEVIDERKEWLKEIIENEHLSSQELEDEIEQEDPPKENQNVRQRSFLGKITDGVKQDGKGWFLPCWLARWRVVSPRREAIVLCRKNLSAL
ncbi:hypothetical protein QJU96_05830 [Pasteurella skyensis]|uniref:Uncharacterized protein n=1 Tax=Phocoenobacter skyensis TaxID=97481 RepID=A0AAJ6NDR9_9PAST|nr:hypothetical protein [Pasteurella skyensis]MDP8170802.1 hypothetical protein [Pasteurella skyensis]MDP8174880.1 hypothetical protein [Pasteurella skyensis]